MIGRRVFGDVSSGGGVDPKADEFKSMVLELMVLAGVFNLGDFIPALDWLDLQGVAAKMKKLHASFDVFLNAILEEHRNGSRVGVGGGGRVNNENSDLLSTLLSLRDNADVEEGGRLSDTEIKALLLVRTSASLTYLSNSLFFFKFIYFIFEIFA